jgi:signal peptidase I
MELDLINFHQLKSIVAKTGKLKFKVVSDSMLPIFKIGDVVTVEPFKQEVLKRFDVVVFWERNRMIIHFLWAKQLDETDGKSIYITKSLKQPLAVDLPIKESLLLGVVNVRIPFMTKVKVFLKNSFK